MSPRLGLVARSEYARGAAVQSRNAFNNLPFERVLLVKFPEPDCECRDDWYYRPGVTVIPIEPDLKRHELYEPMVREFLHGLDAVFSVETLYDWRFPTIARSMNVKTIVQGNPEFVRQGTPHFEHWPNPDQWWWPTRWLNDRMPVGRIMPVPMPDRPLTMADPYSGPLKIYHVVGKKAFADRNGTSILLDAMRATFEPVELTLYLLHDDIEVPRFPDHIKVNVTNEGVDDLWSMHDNQHMLVSPRRYGGLHLPALEAAACGNAVMMPNCSPNDELATVLVPCLTRRELQFASGPIPLYDLVHLELGEWLNTYAKHRDLLDQAQREAYFKVPRWGVWREFYLRAIEQLCGQD